MAECMDEFDEATPLRETYCSRLTTDEYEEQGASCTERALQDLKRHLDGQPELYKAVMKKRRREEREQEGIMAYVKVKLWSLMGGEDASCTVSDLECLEELDKLKTNMMKAHTYSQESKGRRFSRRLAEKRMNHGLSSSLTSTPVRRRKKTNPPPPPPPLPPPPPPLMCTAVTTIPQRRPLAQRNSSAPDQQLKKRPAVAMECILGQLKGSGCRKRLKTTLKRSPGGTPINGWRSQNPPTPEGLRHFNQLLIDKFRNVKTPSPLCTAQASPGSFESPLQS